MKEMKVDLTYALRQIMAKDASPDGRAISLDTSPHKGLTLVYTPGEGDAPHRLKLSRPGIEPTYTELTAARAAIAAVALQPDINQGTAVKEGQMVSITLSWKPLDTRNAFNLSPAQRAKLTKRR